MAHLYRWTDVTDIAIDLEDQYPDTNILSLRFTDLWTMVTKLKSFDDDPQNSSEKVLEAIQAAWLDERDE